MVQVNKPMGPALGSGRGDDDYYEDDRPRKRIDYLRIAVACMAAAFGLILYCSIFRMG